MGCVGFTLCQMIDYTLAINQWKKLNWQLVIY